MSDLLESSVILSDNMRAASSPMEKAATLAAETVASAYKTEENPYYEMQQRVAKAAAVSGLVFGTYEQNSAAKAYNKMDFRNDEYLKEIGMSVDTGSASVKFDKYASASSLTATQDAVSGAMAAANGNISVPLNSLTSDQMRDITSAGVVTVNNAMYNATVSGNTADLSAQGQTFRSANNIKIDVDPLKGIHTMNADVTGLTDAEIKSARSTGSFIRDNVTYHTHGNMSGITGADTVNVSASFAQNSMQAGCAYAAVHAPVQTIDYTASGHALDNMSARDIKMQQNSGIYDLGGIKFNATGIDINEYINLRSNAGSTAQANKSVENLDRSLARGKREKAAVVADVQRTGLDYIKKQDGWLKDHFDGSAGSLRRCESHLKGELRNAKTPEKKAQIEKQLSLLNEYKKHGGTINNPTVNRHYRAGLMAAGGMIMNREMMYGLKSTMAAGKATMAVYRGTRGAVSKLTYMGTSAANKVVSKGMKAITGKNDNIVSRNLDYRQGKKADRYAAKKADRKERAAARRNGTMRQYRARKRDEKWVNHGKNLEDRAAALRGKAGTARGKHGTYASMLDKRAARLEKRGKRFGKISEARANARRALDIKGRIKSAWKNSRLMNSKAGKVLGFGGKAIGKVGAAAKFVVHLPQLIMEKIRKFFIKLVVTPIVAVLGGLYLIMIASMMLIMILSKVVSWNPMETLERSLADYTSVYDRLNSSMNYQQVIIDTVDQDISADFEVVCCVDATFHYLEKKQVPSKDYPWFATPKFGSIQHMWAWEESDNTSRYLTAEDAANKDNPYDENGILKGSGMFMYAQTYKPRDEREELNSLTFNLYPIVAMSRFHYWDELNFEQWETVLGYTYYMYVVSHDIAKYDSNYNEGSNRKKYYEDNSYDPGYDYLLTTCTTDPNDPDPTAQLSPLYTAGIQWYPDIHTLVRSTEQCSNIYIHDFSPNDFVNGVRSTLGNVPEGYREHNKQNNKDRDQLSTYSVENMDDKFILKGRELRIKIANAAKRVFGGADGDNSMVDIVPDTWDKGYTDVNSALSLSLRKKALKKLKISNGVAKYDKSRFNATIQALADSTVDPLTGKKKLDINNNQSGVFIYDGTEASLPHSQAKAKSLDPSDDEHIFKDEVLDQVCEGALCYPYGIVTDTYLNKAEDLLLGSDETDAKPAVDDKGHVAGCHVHTLTCHPLICGEEETNGSEGYYDEVSQTYVEGEPAHHHDISCYDTSEGSVICGHHHVPWTSKDSPGCWKTVAICPGHCGGHIEPQIDIVQKVTYEGLAEDDNFETPHWLTYEEVVSNEPDGVSGFVVSVFEQGLFNTLNDMQGEDIMTVAQWRSYWYSRIEKWFSPLPRSPYNFFKKMGERYLGFYVQSIDAAATGVKAFFKWIGGEADTLSEAWDDSYSEVHNNDDRMSDENSKSETNDHTWEGWWEKPMVFDENLYDEIAGLFGSWEEDKYEASESLWEEQTLADSAIHFPKHGIGGVIFDAEEIEQFLEKIQDAWAAGNFSLDGLDISGLTPEQLAILQAGLERCGKFSYSLSGNGHTNGRFGESGPSDCSGWVSGTLSRALGREINNNAAGYAGWGSRNNPLVPGCVVANSNGGDGYSGHVMIYAGYFDMDGDGSPEHVVMDCSSSQGGSTMRKMKESTLKNNYPYVWYPWE